MCVGILQISRDGLFITTVSDLSSRRLWGVAAQITMCIVNNLFQSRQTSRGGKNTTILNADQHGDLNNQLILKPSSRFYELP